MAGFDNREVAVAAGKKGVARKSVKRDAWLRQGYIITGPMTDNVMKYAAELWKLDRKDDYVDLYLKLLQYHKPKTVAHAVRQQTEVRVYFDGKDSELFDKV
jgi:hypothetical protein